MLKTWQEIPGWFDFQEIYSYAVESASAIQTSIFVEIGTYLGRSAAYMGLEIALSRKPIEFYTIDPFTGNPGEPGYEKGIYEKFQKNIKECRLTRYVSWHKMTSERASKHYPDKSIDFLFIDGLHTYEGVTDDLNNYMPKMKKGAVIAGHDYLSSKEVKRAVDDFFRGKHEVKVSGISWIVQL